MATKKTAETKEFKMEQVLAMWKQKAKGGTEYFTGKAFGKKKLVGFYNGKKKNPKEPDIRIYGVDGDGKAEKEEFLSLWVNVSKNGKKFLSGKLNDKKVVGFINKSENENAPYFSCYYSESTPKKADTDGTGSTGSTEFAEVDEKTELPF